jgi:broad specificity phosphatase PhoE
MRCSRLLAASTLHMLPKRLVLIRHGQSVANVDDTEYERTPDWKIALTPKGEAQASDAGARLSALVQAEPVYLYVSPYRRAQQTLRHARTHLNEAAIIGEREDPRLREQDMGNYQSSDGMKDQWRERDEFGRFFYRFPNGENGADVCDRVSSFLDSAFRERSVSSHPADTNVVVVSHGLMIRLFIKRWFHFTVETFEQMRNPPNAGFIVLERTVSHDDDGHRQYKMTLTEESRQLLRVPRHIQCSGRYGE